MTHARKFDPANWARLVSPERRALLDPELFLARLAIAAGSTVADLGAGPGFFTEALADRVGAEGRVLALDVSEEMVEVLRSRPLPSQVEVRQSEENRLPVEDGTVDLALLAFVLHELHDPARFLAEVRRILAPGGRLVVLEWVPQVEAMGPPLAERLAPERSERILADAGFAVVEQGMANASNYYLVTSAGA